jgi:hypothetical protein
MRGYTRYGENVEKTFQSVDINSREELQALADEEDREINWELWDKLVEQTKQDIKQELQGFERMYTNPVFVFDIWKQKVIKTFKNPSDCANYYNIAKELVHKYIRDHRVYYKLGIEFRQ